MTSGLEVRSVQARKICLPVIVFVCWVVNYKFVEIQGEAMGVFKQATRDLLAAGSTAFRH
jgi:hypothetical protein